MPVSALTQILLRLVALKWIVEGLAHLVSALATSRIQEEVYFLNFAATLACFVVGAMLWLVAPRLSHWMAGKENREINLKGVTLQQLFATVLLGLGGWFALQSFGEAFNWIHFFAIARSSEYRFHPNDQPSYYDLTETAITFVAGVALIGTARIWARKLCPEGAADPSSTEAGEGEGRLPGE
ncbi:MAG: hypothetical protein P1U87_08045 [Verrucomicrobiales bacterium]|nr:hypothetical protein [Verrucomicrobiales bacterium]